MSNPREGGNTLGISIWDQDLDHPNQFVPDVSLSGQMGDASSSKPKKPRTANKKDPEYPPPKYTNFAYKTGLQWYEDKSTEYLDKNYLRHQGTGIDKLKDVFFALVMEKCNGNAEYEDVQDVYHNRFYAWMANVQQSCIFNTKKLMLDFRPLVPGFPEDEAASKFREKMEWWQSAVRRFSRQQTRGIGWQAAALKAEFAKDGA